jgi:fructokinase
MACCGYGLNLMHGSASVPAIVSIGEALFDNFNGRKVLGGAPLNFAVHASALLVHQPQSAAVISRVGNDPDGQRLIVELEQRKLDTRWVQHDPAHPTGQAVVTTNAQGEPEYDIVRDVAWDFLEFTPDVAAAAAGAKLVCFSTLAQRSNPSRTTIERFVDTAGGIRLFDVNLRQQYYSRSLLSDCLRRATHVKLNQDELHRVCELLEIDGTDLLERCERLITRFDLQLVALTRGASGTLLRTVDRTIEGAPVSYPPAPGADSVGAGDACNAGLAVGLLLGWELDRVVSLGNHCGAYVASQRGATPPLPDALLELHQLH